MQTCELVDMAKYDVVIDNPDDVAVELFEIDEEIRALDDYRADVYMFNVSAITDAVSDVNVKAISKADGEEIASTTFTVTSRIPQEFKSICDKARSEGRSIVVSETYAVAGANGSFHPLLNNEFPYNFPVILWDSEQCKMLKVGDFDIEVTSEDDKSEIVAPADENPGEYVFEVGLRPLELGLTNVKVVANLDGAVVAESVIPVQISE